MGLREYTIRRSVQSVITLVVVLSLNFFVFHAMPGNPYEVLKLSNYRNTQVVQRLTEKWGLNKPLWEQFLLYWFNLLKLDFGQSIVISMGTPVTSMIAKRLLNSIILLGAATTVSSLIGITIGVYIASKHGHWQDRLTTTISLIFYSMPLYWLGLILILIFSVWLRWFPMGNTISAPAPKDPLLYALDYMWHMVLPLITLTILSFGSYVYLMRQILLEVFTSDYMITARAKGLDEKTILFKHAMRNALLPLITVLALSYAGVVSGAVLTETVFSWYGVGRLLFDAVLRQDFPVLEFSFLIISIVTILANFIADILYGFLDPRVRYG